MKRFTETDKWKDPWFRKLDNRLKLLWFWLCDQCDNAGIINPDIELASFQIGVEVSESDLSRFEDRLIQIENGKWMLPKFIPFQYGELSDSCPAHKPVFRSLENNRVLNGYSKGINTLQEKDKSKDKDKDTAAKPRKRSDNTGMDGSVSDDAWLASLRSNHAYAGLDFDHELREAKNWITRRPARRFTRRFFEGWLKRADKPLNVAIPELLPSQKY